MGPVSISGRRWSSTFFERGEVPPPTVGPLVPLWIHVNVAKAMLLDDATPAEFEQQKLNWEQHPVQTWNPFAAPGSAAGA